MAEGRLGGVRVRAAITNATALPQKLFIASGPRLRFFKVAKVFGAEGGDIENWGDVTLRPLDYP